jgi:hypothetical protein
MGKMGYGAGLMSKEGRDEEKKKSRLGAGEFGPKELREFRKRVSNFQKLGFK